MTRREAPPAGPAPPLLTVREAAALKGCSPKAVRAAVHRGALCPARASRPVLLARAAVEAWAPARPGRPPGAVPRRHLLVVRLTDAERQALARATRPGESPAEALRRLAVPPT